MQRFVVITVGKTHSGKTTFARALEKALADSLVLDQDNHAAFINTHYRAMLPQRGTNKLKYALTTMLVNYAIRHTGYHLILCNANRNQQGRMKLLEKCRAEGFQSILVYFAIPHRVLKARVAKTKRSTLVFRSASSFEEVLSRQLAEDDKLPPPASDEADYYLELNGSNDMSMAIQRIIDIVGTC